MNKTSVTTGIKTKVDSSVEISLELAAKMVKNYHDQNPQEDSNTVDIPKEIIFKILNQPNCAGVRISNAISQEGSNCLVYIGYDKENNTLFEISSIDSQGKLNFNHGTIGSSVVATLGGGQTKPGGGWFSD